MIVEIRKVSTGETRSYEMSFEFNEFIWTEGNFASDCNRYLFFARACNEDEEEVGCSDGAYKVRITENGVVVYDEFE